jgi:hypothetical protein
MFYDFTEIREKLIVSYLSTRSVRKALRIPDHCYQCHLNLSCMDF